MSNSLRVSFRWFAIAALVGLLSGGASALFLYLLEAVTDFRNTHVWLVALLPVGGLLIGLLYERFGSAVEAGNNLIIDEFHDPRAVIPFRMAPLVLLGTLLTHLFGGSAGREGTAVQMGGSIADQFTRVLGANPTQRKNLLMAGMAGGFGSIFGVPFAGTLFGIEVLSIGRLELSGLIDCAIAAFVAHHVALALGVHHVSYPHPEPLSLTVSTAFFAITAGLFFGLVARLFAELTEGIKAGARRLVSRLSLRACAGGALIAAAFFAFPPLIRYVGLGVPVIVSSLTEPVSRFDWLGKLVMTALTLGTGFKGGEVTPLLFIGSTLGNALSSVLALPLGVCASIGFVAVFAGAANTPLACTVMAMELFGPGLGIYAALACFASFAVSGESGIYHSQRVHRRKINFHAGFRKTMRFLRRI